MNIHLVRLFPSPKSRIMRGPGKKFFHIEQDLDSGRIPKIILKPASDVSRSEFLKNPWGRKLQLIMAGFICTFSLLISLSITLRSSKFRNKFTTSSKYFDMVCNLKRETYSGPISFEVQQIVI